MNDYKLTLDDLRERLQQLQELETIATPNLLSDLIEQFKKGGIHIKKKNRGKFTASAKKAGKSVQEHARAVLNNPNATPLQKKRANFARNAAKWNKK